VPGATSTSVIPGATSTTTYDPYQGVPPGYTPEPACLAGGDCTATSVAPALTLTKVGPPTKLFVEGPITITLSPRAQTGSHKPTVHDWHR
jgi:hypothetical protein